MMVLEQTTVTVGENSYLVTALDATNGLAVMHKMMEFSKNEQAPTAEFMRNLILKSVTVNNKQANEEWFNKYFSRKYHEVYELFTKIQEFNFGTEEQDPNEQSDTSE